MSGVVLGAYHTPSDRSPSRARARSGTRQPAVLMRTDLRAELLGARLHVVAQALGALGLAAAARMPVRPARGADEDVALE